MKKYENGYKEKLKYWGDKYSTAVKEMDTEAMKVALSKLSYFNERHSEWIASQEKSIEKGMIVAYTDENGNSRWGTVTRVTKKTVNAGRVWDSKKNITKGIPIETVKEVGAAFYANWRKSDTYRCM